MRRLTYSPHAWVFIRSANMGGRIYDVSDDLVRGSVTQNVNDVHKAQFELRNRFKKWLRDPVTKQSIFLPMDLVTIWLQRLPGSPIQQFTGYLDTVPYYQAYPANAMFSATCTLKKAAFTWFDPGLATFQQWLISNGWALDPSSGQAINKWTYASTGTQVGNTPFKSNINDGGIGELLSRFMTEVAFWQPNDVLVSDLPRDIPKIAASLYADITNEATQDLEALSDFMRRAMGVKGTNLATVSTSQQSDSRTGGLIPQVVSGSAVSSKTLALAKEIKLSAVAANIPPIELAYAARVLTNFDETYSFGPEDGDKYGYGIYRLRTYNKVGDKTVLSIGAKSYSPSDLLSASVASDALCQLLHAALNHNSNWLVGAKRGDLKSIHDWLQDAVNLQSIPYIDGALDDANQFLGADIPNANAGGAQSVDPNSVAWDSPSLQNLLTAAEKTTISQYYKSKAAWLPALAYRAKYFNQSLRISRPPSSYQLQSDQLYVTGQPDTLDAFFNSLKGDSTLDEVERFGPSTDHKLLRQGVVSNNFNVSLTVAKIDAVTLLQTKPAGFVAANQIAVTSTTSSAPGTISATDMAAFSATSATAANLAFPVDIIASQTLTGEKALMNDTSCLDAIKQFAAASMRAFRTLPDGRFLAFYPDYFGAYRDPYWKIHNIELIDFGIQLNDEQLATHVYVTGDTINFDGQVDLWEQAGTAGVATISHANMLNSFIEPWNKDKSVVGKLNTAFKFLEHYGARPYPEKQPLIRNTAFEFLYAWQRFMQKWAAQFSTSVEFTFHPEIMAGGLIEFPDHKVQCFVESVTHTFDYEAGFSSEAILSAPSLPKAYRGKGQSHPGFALAGNINSVGTAA